MCTEVYKLLAKNHVEDDDNMFSSKKLVSFITGVPARIQVRGDIVTMAEVNFLCVHKKLRSKRLAPVMIKEVTRRVQLENIWQATLGTRMTMSRTIKLHKLPESAVTPGFRGQRSFTMLHAFSLKYGRFGTRRIPI
ncbi:hypothetical protein V6N13_011253 [Hibiscus sabdariffa]